MRVAYLWNNGNGWIRKKGKDLLTSSYLLLKHYILKKNSILPDYDSFAYLLDPKPLVLSITQDIDFNVLRNYDLLIWEWGWGNEGPRQIINIRKKLDIPILVFPGPLDRFWREVEKETIKEHLRACALVNYVGVMLEDTVGFYQAMMPQARVFHMPVPVDTGLFNHFAIEPFSKNSRHLLLTAPTLFFGQSSQIPITSYFVFKKLLTENPDLSGMCFVYSKDEREDAQDVFKDLNIAEKIEIYDYTRPIISFFDRINSCYAGIFMPHTLIQGRTALICACLGIPLVVSTEIETHKRLFPQTSVPWTDSLGAVRKADRLLKDKSFYEDVRKYAWDKIEFYNVENCRKRILEGIGVLGQ